MINITDKHNCCGCSACEQSCPRKCISMRDDSEGFKYPVVNQSTCIDCKICERVCPVLNHIDSRTPIAVYAAKSKDESERLNSSSGGVFSVLAKKVLAKTGKVYGAAFDNNWNVIHCSILDEKELYRLQGSKYVQSAINDTYSQIKRDLIANTNILFSGTPCQVAGLSNYLSKEYDNLITIEIVCHGVPSPLVWHDYLSLNRNITKISFRNKKTGWRDYSIVINCDKQVNEIACRNLYMQAFLKNLSIRPSCYKCVMKPFKSGADITLGDFWGIWDIFPEIDDNKGVSAVIVNTEKGQKFLDDAKFDKWQVPTDGLLKANISLTQSAIEPIERPIFWEEWQKKNYYIVRQLCKKHRESFLRRVLNMINQ